MSKRKLLAFASIAVAGAMALSACTPQATPGGNAGNAGAAAGGSVSVMWNQAFFSANSSSNSGNATANNNILYMMRDPLMYYDNNLQVQPNEGLGTYEKISDEPLTVQIKMADTAQWSDGVPVDAADVILEYGAVSALFNTIVDEEEIEELYDDEGEIVEVEAGKVYFESGSPSVALVKEFPEISDDQKTITYKYSEVYADWEKTPLSYGVPAHVVARIALGEEDATAGKKAIIDAFANKDEDALSKIANVWNTGFNMNSMPEDKTLLLSSGPYEVTEFKKDEYLTLTKNENYKGNHVPALDKVTVRYSEDPQAAVQALQNNEVQLISPQATADILEQVNGLSGVKVISGDEATYEHVDLTYNNGGPFDPAAYDGDTEKAKKVRQAFLHTIPRADIIERLIKPLNPNAEIRNSFNVIPGAPAYDGVVAANGMKETYGDGPDVEAAKKLLEEAGVANPKVRFLYGASNERRAQEFRLIKEAAEKAGFEMVDAGNDLWGQMLGDKSYDASLFGWQSTGTGVTEADANYRSKDKATGSIKGQNNFSGFASTEVNALYDELGKELDEAKQQKINEQVEKILVDDAFGIVIFQFPSVTAHTEDLQGIDPISIAPTIFWNFWEWKLA